MRLRGRPHGSGYESQWRILQALDDEGTSSKEIRLMTRLSKTTIAENLKIVMSIGAVKRIKSGRRIIYQETGDWFIRWFVYLLYQRNLMAWNAIRMFRKWCVDLQKKVKSLEKLIELRSKYDSEIRQAKSKMPRWGQMEVWDALRFSKEFNYIKREYRYVRQAHHQAPTTPSYREIRSAHEDYLDMSEWFKQNLEASTKSDKPTSLVIYCRFVAYFFPELLEWAEKHSTKGDLTLDLWDELDEKVRSLIETKKPLLQAWSEAIRQKIDRAIGDISKGSDNQTHKKLLE